ncbi:MAG: LUD domain-containing protein [Bacteroidetes bacterium]|nr:LUD domain-containing protein [Bacteroidota bacterium]MBL6944806.1 LUD domain-containing protein [Bacteroidales bacterium]
MKESTSKEKVLKNIRNALISKLVNPFKNVDFSSPVFRKQEEVPEVQFASKLVESGGIFIYCLNEKEVISNLEALIEKEGWKNIHCLDDKLNRLLAQGEIDIIRNLEEYHFLEVGITACDFLISRFGSVMVSSGLGSGRRIFVFPETHVVIANASQVVHELKDALTAMKKKYAYNFPSQITVITGPSRTADIEKTLVMGAHGPKNLYVFMIDDM